MAQIDDLKAAVANETTEQESVITLLNGIAAQLAAANSNQPNPDVQAVIDQINTNTAAMAAAVTANTPSAAAPPPPTPPTA